MTTVEQIENEQQLGIIQEFPIINEEYQNYINLAAQAAIESIQQYEEYEEFALPSHELLEPKEQESQVVEEGDIEEILCCCWLWWDLKKTILLPRTKAGSNALVQTAPKYHY